MARNPLRMDPTKTGRIRRQFSAEINKRFRQLKGDINRLVIEEDAFAIGQFNARSSRPFTLNSGVQTRVWNTRWAGLTDAAKVQAFRQWLAARVDALLLPSDDGINRQSYWKQFIASGYGKGLNNAFDAVKRSGAAITKIGALQFSSAKEQFLQLSFGGPVAQDKIDLIAGRVFSDLKGVTEQMSTNISRELVDGLTRGDSPRTVARLINKQVDKIGKQRALTIAQTESIRAHAEGNLDAMEKLGVDKVNAAVEWSTAGDANVCVLCQPLEGVVMSIREARGLVPRHPRCVAGDMRVIAPNPLAMFKTHYTGEIIELVTVGGRRVSVTPAHVLLTKYGFARAEAIHNGLDLLVDDGMYGGFEEPDYEHAVPRIADEFGSATEGRGMLTVSVPLTAEHLHGEGRACDKKVDIVFPDGMLRCGWQSNNGQPIGNSFLSVCHGGIGGNALSTFTQTLLGVSHSADRSMGRCRDALAFLLSAVLEAKQISLGTITGTDPGISKPLHDHVTPDAELLRHCLDGHPTLKRLNDCSSIDLDTVFAGSVAMLAASLSKSCLNGVPLHPVVLGDLVDGPTMRFVQYDKVVSVRRAHVEAFPVYDVQTTSTAYSVGGVLSSNCRCGWIPADDIGGKVDKKKLHAAIARSVRAGSSKKTRKLSLTKQKELSTWAGAAK